MIARLLHRLGVGRIPESTARDLENEGIVLEAQGVWGSMTLRHFRGMGRVTLWNKSGCVGSLVLTRKRLYGRCNFRTVIDIPLKEERLGSLKLDAVRPGLLDITFDAAVFMPATGQVSLRFRTPLAAQFQTALAARPHSDS